MNPKKPTIWINVTTSKSWQRPPVGIVRVENLLCEELKKIYGSRLKQCIWKGNHFEKWLPEDPSNLIGRNEDDSEISKTVKLSSSLIYPVLSKRKAVAAIAQGIISLMPLKVSVYFSKVLLFTRPIVIRIISSNKVRAILSIKNQIKFIFEKFTTRKHIEVADREIIFMRDDILISVGLDWDYSFYKSFYSLRKNHGLKIITCCYDMIPVLYPQYCVSDVANKFVSYFIEIADGSDLILCISKQTQKDLNEKLHQFGAARPLTHILPLGDFLHQEKKEEVSKQVQTILQEPFILFVSTIERRKNHEVLYRAYHLLCREGKTKLPKLVFVGMQGWGVNELLKDIELDPLTKNLIITLNHVNDTELYKLYKSSLFSVFPSLYEGWGLAVGEALSFGKAVISSNRGSLPEIAGDLVRYVDPWDVKAWADEIYKMVHDDDFRAICEEKIRKNFQPKKWSETASVVASLINDFNVEEDK